MDTKLEKTLAVIGLGYVGLPLALLAEKKGYKVVGIDINERRVESINKRELPFKDEEMQMVLKESRIKACSDFSEVALAGTVVVCVPTPVNVNKMPDYEPVKSAFENVGQYLKKGQLIILESTVNPGVSEEIVVPILERTSGLTAGKDFSLAHCPERINPGDPKWNVSNIARVVGGFDKESTDRALEFYTSIVDAPIMPMSSLKEAEAVKIVENSFRNINIAFVNELARSFSRLGIDVVNVINGAATKPFAFMAHYPGCGVGGHCIPVDPYYLIEYAKEKNGFRHEFLALACKTNDDMSAYTADLVKEQLNASGIDVTKARIAVLGLAYKKNISDCRESPSFGIIKSLEDMGAKVLSFDPFVPERSSVKTLDEAVKNTDIVVIATDHDVFKALAPEYFKDNKVKIIIDGRNCLPIDKFSKSGIIYKGIGR